MKIKFSAIVTLNDALKAVERDGYALRYVLDIEIFKSIALKFNISIEV